MVRFYIANWKMNMTFFQSLSFVAHQYNDLIAMSNGTTLIIAPSLIFLSPLIEMFRATTIKISAQNCSPYQQGAYTGEISAQSLREVACNYCIVGHSERRELFHETEEIIAQKVSLLLDYSIIPSICIGETDTEHKEGITKKVLHKQLDPIFPALHTKNNVTLMIAYEPIWSIGTMNVPDNEYLIEILSWIKEQCSMRIPEATVHLLYGGSVNATNSPQLKTIAILDGFLIGSSSTNFQLFQKIVS